MRDSPQQLGMGTTERRDRKRWKVGNSTEAAMVEHQLVRKQLVSHDALYTDRAYLQDLGPGGLLPVQLHNRP